MKISIGKKELEFLIVKQLTSLFGISEKDKQLIHQCIAGGVLVRLEQCFSKNPNKYYSHNGETFFNPFHSAQYTIFLYYLSNAISKESNNLLADKIYYLNKTLNACDLFYAIELPDFFMLEHPVGSVMGRAKYEEGFMFYQNCTVGGNSKLEYPVIGKNVHMFANSSIIGNCHVGDNVLIGAGALIKNEDIPSGCLVFGQSPNLIIKKRKDI